MYIKFNYLLNFFCIKSYEIIKIIINITKFSKFLFNLNQEKN